MAESMTSTLEINATPEELYEIVTDLETYPEWVKGVEEVEVLERTDDDYPARARMVIDAGIRRVGYTLTYEYDYPNSIKWTNEPGGDIKLIDGVYRFEPNDDGSTTAIYDLTIDPGFRVPGFMLRQAQRAIMSAALEGLRRQVEQE